jgi:acyl-CoA thioester hydrolase
VYYANYLRYMERCRSEWLRTCDIGQEVLRQQGVLFVVTETGLKYRRPARLDDSLLVTLSVADLGKARIRINHEVWRQDQSAAGPQLLVTGEVTVACMATSGKPLALPAVVREKIESYGRLSG